jgi:antirestriction protein ArdC
MDESKPEETINEGTVRKDNDKGSRTRKRKEPHATSDSDSAGKRRPANGKPRKPGNRKLSAGKIYEAVTRAIIDLLGKGVAAWNKPWGGTDAAIRGNTGEPYRGFNQLALSVVRRARRLTSTVWLTWKQVAILGGTIKPDKRKEYVNIIFYKNFAIREVADDGGVEEKTVPVPRYYRVWNLDDTEGVQLPPRISRISTVIEREFSAIDACENVVAGYLDKPKIVHDEQAAFYLPGPDIVNVPKPQTFKTNEDYYATLFHELSHSTGHRSRLDREGIKPLAFGLEDYSKEELIAEMSAAYLCGVAGISNATLDQSASYIKEWSIRLKKDPKLLISAASQAQKSADYILGATRSAAAADDPGADDGSSEVDGAGGIDNAKEG